MPQPSDIGGLFGGSICNSEERCRHTYVVCNTHQLPFLVLQVAGSLQVLMGKKRSGALWGRS